MPSKKSVRGAGSHKNPDCKCISCTARRRRAETLPVPVGVRGTSPTTQEVVNTENPLVLIGTRRKDKIREYIAQWLAIRAQTPEATHAEIAKQIGIDRHTLGSAINRAVKEGWLKFDDPMSRIDHEIIPKVLDNLNELLDQKDKQTTIETAKGTLFKPYQDSKNASDTTKTALVLNIETAHPDSVKIVSGTVVGKPREIH